MVVEYNINSNLAELKLQAFHGLHGALIYSGLTWQVRKIHPDPAHAILYSQEEAQAFFELPSGDYEIFVFYQNETFKLGYWHFAANTRTHLAFILKQKDRTQYDAEEGYYAESDPLIDYQLRVEQRNRQAKYGGTTTPLISPDVKQVGELSVQASIQAHPILTLSPQFDGMDPKVNPDITVNSDALAIELKYIEAQQPALQSAPTPFKS